MEPIPLSGGQLMLTNPDDHTLLARDPALIGGALAYTQADLDRMRMTCPEVPVGLTAGCPPLPADCAPPVAERYMGCGSRQTFITCAARRTFTPCARPSWP